MWLSDSFLITVSLALPISHLLPNRFLFSSGPDTFTPQASNECFSEKGFLGFFYNRTNIMPSPLLLCHPIPIKAKLFLPVFVSINVNQKSQRNASQPPAVWLKPIDWTTQEGCKALLKSEEDQAFYPESPKGNDERTNGTDCLLLSNLLTV